MGAPVVIFGTNRKSLTKSNLEELNLNWTQLRSHSGSTTASGPSGPSVRFADTVTVTRVFKSKCVEKTLPLDLRENKGRCKKLNPPPIRGEDRLFLQSSF